MLVGSFADKHEMQLVKQLVDLKDLKLCSLHVFVTDCLLVLRVHCPTNHEVFNIF